MINLWLIYLPQDIFPNVIKSSAPEHAIIFLAISVIESVWYTIWSIIFLLEWVKCSLLLAKKRLLGVGSKELEFSMLISSAFSISCLTTPWQNKLAREFSGLVFFEEYLFDWDLSLNNDFEFTQEIKFEWVSINL